MHLKILNLNLWEGGLLWENIESFLRLENPDILCLQEANTGTADQPENFHTLERLTPLFPEYYSYFSPELHQTWPDGTNGDAGNLIFSRFPIAEQKTIFLHGEYERIIRDEAKGFSHYPKNMQSVILDVGEKSLHVLNMHGVWGLDGGDTPERLKMSEMIIDEIRGKSPLVLMGDFNLKPDTETIRNIEAHLTNVFAGEMESSFNMRHKTNPGYATAVVDMFFATSDIQIVAKSIPDDDVSDHKPLLVSVEI